MTIRLIGYWRSDSQPGWPDPRAFVDPAWNDDERRVVTRYLEAGTIAQVYRGYSPCRFCGAQNGDCDYTDGVYLWPQGLAHYVAEHGVRLPGDFVLHAVSRIGAIETAEIDGVWWSEQSGP